MSRHSAVSLSPPGGVAHAGFALWNLGFRPFYLLAGMFASISILRKCDDTARMQR